jgi:hypothetical protein
MFVLSFATAIFFTVSSKHVEVHDNLANAYIPPCGCTQTVAQLLPDGGLSLGGVTSDAGVVQLSDAGAALYVGCDVCADDGNNSAIYCAADPAVVATAGSPHKGIPLSPTIQLCRLITVASPTQVYCAPNSSASPFNAHCY